MISFISKVRRDINCNIKLNNKILIMRGVPYIQCVVTSCCFLLPNLKIFPSENFNEGVDDLVFHIRLYESYKRKKKRKNKFNKMAFTLFLLLLSLLFIFIFTK